MRLLDLIYRARLVLDDEAKSRATPSAGYSFVWEEDDTPNLWKNEELTAYANAACMELAHRCPIVDSSRNPITTVYLRPGAYRYPLDSRILAVDAVTLESTSTPLVRLSDADDRNEWIDGDESKTDLDSVGAYRVDFDEYAMTVYATPTEKDTLLLAVRRLPKETMLWSRRTVDEPEFPEHKQEALIEWICGMAYMKRDTDTTEDRSLSGYYKGLFADRVGPRVDFRHARVLKEVSGKRLRTRAYY